jgi:hypothetical protein
MKVHVQLFNHPGREDASLEFDLEVDPSQVTEPGEDTPGVIPVLKAALAAAEALQ